ncbi:MAG: pyridoxal phosphate-dependent aminotransferase [Verrucomicrobia bacterium]|nr:pyridoxal phosphate-dependent aminotransferase [Verrucomicrobiota bacterium]
MFSSRLDFADTTNALSKARDRRKVAGQTTIDLSDSNPANAGFSWSVADLGSLLRREGIQRQDPDPHGLAVTRTAISDYYSASTSESYSWLFKLLCNPGDEVLVPEPAYPLLEIIAALEGVTLRPYQVVQLAGEWVIDTASLSVTRQTKAIVCINPSNPTGSFVSRRDRDVLRGFAQKHGLAILCDEVFLDYPAEGVASPGTWAGEAQVATFVLSGLSKVALTPQLKLRASVRARVAQGDAAVRLWATNSGSRCTVLPRASGWSAIITLPPGVSEEKLLLNAIDEGVWAHPGYFYGMAAITQSVVLSLLTPPDTLSAGLQALDRALKRS